VTEAGSVNRTFRAVAGPIVVPVVDDVPQEVGVRPDGDRPEEVAADHLTTFQKPGPSQIRHRPLDGVLAVQIHVGPPMTIRYKDFFLKALPDDLPLTNPEQAVIPPDSRKVVPQGQDKPRKTDAG
jgi:hypothetical protein